MRQDIAYGIIALMLIGPMLLWWVAARKARRGRKGNLRINLFKKREE